MRTGLTAKIRKLDERVAAIERKVWMAAGFAAAAGGLLGTAVSKLLSSGGGVMGDIP